MSLEHATSYSQEIGNRFDIQSLVCNDCVVREFRENSRVCDSQSCVCSSMILSCFLLMYKWNQSLWHYMTNAIIMLLFVYHHKRKQTSSINMHLSLQFKWLSSFQTFLWTSLWTFSSHIFWTRRRSSNNEYILQTKDRGNIYSSIPKTDEETPSNWLWHDFFLDKNQTFIGSGFPFMATSPLYSKWKDSS